MKFNQQLVRQFCSVFCPASTDDEARDLENQKRIRSFNWITPQHLDAAINPSSDKVQQLIEEAQEGMIHFRVMSVGISFRACVNVVVTSTY